MMPGVNSRVRGHQQDRLVAEGVWPAQRVREGVVARQPHLAAYRAILAARGHPRAVISLR